MDCFSRCFSKPPPKDDSEWVQPVGTPSKRHVAPAGEGPATEKGPPSPGGPGGKKKNRASVSVSATDLVENRVSWSHMVDNLADMSLNDLDMDDGQFDESLMKSLAVTEDMRDSQLEHTMGRISMGSMANDSVGRGLGAHPQRLSVDTKVSSILKPSKLAAGTGKELLRSNVKKVMFATASLQKFARTSKSASSNSVAAEPAITSIAALGGGFFLTASRSDNVIKLHKIVGEKAEFVKEFKGHKSKVTALAALDKKGRFLSASVDQTVILWDSRFDIEESDDEEHEPKTLLATFRGFDRYVESVGVLDEGSFVRPTDDIDMAMVTAMAKKTALEGTASVQRAAFQRKIIECSGTFATASTKDRNVNIWAMSVTKDSEEDAAKITLDQELEHEASVGVMVATENMVLTADIVGEVFLWEQKRGSFGGKGSWAKIHKFTPWRSKSKAVRNTDTLVEQSAQALCFLDKGTIVSGTKNGVVRVWPDIGTLKDFEVNKKQASSVKVTSQAVTSIKKLPPVRDPNTGEKCMAFSVSFRDGRMVSMALYPQDPSDSKAKKELVMFHVYANDSVGINDIDVCDCPSSEPVLLAGDENGEIKTMKPKWNSSSSASV